MNQSDIENIVNLLSNAIRSRDWDFVEEALEYVEEFLEETSHFEEE
jgi:hypothetical protein